MVVQDLPSLLAQVVVLVAAAAVMLVPVLWAAWAPDAPAMAGLLDT